MLIPMAVFSQECKVKSVTDKFSQLPKLTTGFMDLSGISLTIDADNKEIDFFFALNSGEADCFDDNSSVLIIYEGGKMKATFKNAGSMNCQGLFHLIFKNVPNTPSTLLRLTTKKVLSIKFTSTSKKETLLELTPEQQDMFMKAANCLVTEAKTLIKK